MVEEENMSMDEMKKILKEANLLEDNMSLEEVIQTCKIIRQSKISVNDEIKNSSLIETQKSLIDAMGDDSNTISNPEIEQVDNRKDKDEDKLSEVIENLPSLFSEELVNQKFQDATKFDFGFNDMLKSTGSMLDIITHTSKYIPFQKTDKFLEASLIEKAKITYQYHSSVNKLKTKIARCSFNPAPMPKEINLLDSRDINLYVNSEEVDDETYISRSGRHTKRKLYCDYEEDSSSENSFRKKTKTGLLKKSAVNKSIKKLEESPSTEVVSVEETACNAATSVDVPKSNSIKKLANPEIMSRSSLFKDSPVQLTRSRLTRSELMFDKLLEDEKEKKKSEKQMEKFQQTLQVMQEDSEPEREVIMVDDEESSKVRVVPPIPGRKPINARKNKTNVPPPLDITIKSSNKSSTSVNNNTDVEDFPPFQSIRRNRPWLSKNKNPVETPSSPTSSKTSTSSDVACPICSKSFSQLKIEDHASACGD